MNKNEGLGLPLGKMQKIWSITNGRRSNGTLKPQRHARKQGSSPCPHCHAYNHKTKGR